MKRTLIAIALATASVLAHAQAIRVGESKPKRVAIGLRFVVIPKTFVWSPMSQSPPPPRTNRSSRRCGSGSVYRK